MKHPLHALLPAAACLLALACGYEASTPPTLLFAPSPAAASPAAPPPAAPSPAAVSPTSRPSAATPPADACIDVDDELGGAHVTLEGLVFIDDAYEHPTRGKTRPAILRLDAPRCARGLDEPRVTEVHLAPSEDIALKPFVGKHVRVAGDPFAAHTAWHARPVVLMTTHAIRLP